MDLPVKYKAFWFYICDQCDCAGIWEPNMRLAVAQIGEPMELVEILRIFEKRIEQTEEGKLWIRGFIKFQYGLELNPKNSAHLGVLRRLEINKLQSPVEVAPEKGIAQGLNRGYLAPQDKDKDKDKDKKRESTEREKQKARPENQKEVEDFCVSLDLKPSDGEAMWLRWQSQGYGKTRDWKATIRQWKIQGYHPSQKQSQPLPHPKQPAPIYDKLPPTREVSDEEFLKHQHIAKEAADKFREEQQARLRSA